MKIVRWILGIFILSYEKLFSPKGVQRPFSEQAEINTETRKLTLYQYKACPFCLKVRLAIKRQSLTIKTRDAKRSETAKQELLNGAGKLKVPCLKIEDGAGGETWMFESSDIINYLEGRFGVQKVQAA